MKGLIFSPKSINDILDLKKDATRRVSKVKQGFFGDHAEYMQHPFSEGVFQSLSEANYPALYPAGTMSWVFFSNDPVTGDWVMVGDTMDNFEAPRFVPNEIIYAKEPYIIDPFSGEPVYQANCIRNPELLTDISIRWKNAMFMPEIHSRLLLKVKRFWIEPLSMISKKQAQREGYNGKQAFFDAWDHINGKRKHGAYLSRNDPMVDVINFEIFTMRRK